MNERREMDDDGMMTSLELKQIGPAGGGKCEPPRGKDHYSLAVLVSLA
jgi:hypothetical protein